MCSLRAAALAILVAAASSVFAADETLPAPPVANLPAGQPQIGETGPAGVSVLCVALPRDGNLDNAEVDFQFADGRAVTKTSGSWLDGQWLLEKLAWSDDGEQVILTLRNGEERRELRVAGDLVAQAGTRPKIRNAAQIQSQFYEVPALAARRVRRALDATPGEDRSALAMLDRALDNGAPAQLLTPPQFEALTKFLAGCAEVDAVSAPRIITKSGQHAVIEIIREFRYPTEWKNDPTLPKPLTPSAFDTRNCGVTLEIEPAVQADGSLVTLDLTPQIVEFLGAADLEKGTPYPRRNPDRHLPGRALTLAAMPDTHGRPVHYIFSRRTTKTRVSLLPGYGALLSDLNETEAEAPFEKTAPKGRIIVLVKADLLPQ